MPCLPERADRETFAILLRRFFRAFGDPVGPPLRKSLTPFQWSGVASQ